MSDNIVIEILRAMRADISDIKADIHEIRERLGFVEQQYASLLRRVDRIGDDVQRIKHRLELVDAS